MSDLTPASGQGAEYFTDRSLFFLENRVRIYEWFGLRYDAMQSISRFLESLAEPITEASTEWIPWDGTIGKYRCLFLVPAGVDISEFPWTGVALGWVPQGVMPDMKNQAPWVGLYGYPEHESAGKLRSALDAIDAGTTAYESSNPWPRFQWVPGTDTWWTDLDGYRTRLIDAYVSLLNRYKAAIESVV